MNGARARRLAAAVALAFAVPVLCAPGVLWGEVFWYRDTWQYFWPLRELVADGLARGAAPLWTSQVGAGIPLLASPTLGAAYPGNILIAALPAGIGFTWFLVLHLALAGLSARALARAHGAGEAGGVLAGIVYAASGPLLSHTSACSHLCAAAWIPLALLAALHLARGGGRRWGVVAAIALACVVLGGAAQLALYTAAAMAITAVCAADAEAAGTGRRLARLLPVGLFAAALAAVQILPTAEWLGQIAAGVPGQPDAPAAGRAIGWAKATATSWRPDYLAADLLWPGLLGNPARRQFFTSSGLGARFTLQAFAGVTALALALFAGRPAQRAGRAPAVWCLLAAWLALGKYGGLYWLCYQGVPGFASFRYPDKSLTFLALGLAVLAGRGLHHWLAEAPASRFDRRDRGPAVLAGIAVAGGVALLGMGAASALPEAATAWRWAAARGMVLAVVAASVLYVVRPGRWRGPAWTPGLLVAGFALLECAVVNGPVAATEPRGPWLERSLLAQAAGDAEPHRWRTHVLGAPSREVDLTAWSLRKRRHGTHTSAVFDGRASLGVYDTTRLRGYVETVEQTGSAAWLGALGVRWLGSERPLRKNPALRLAADHPSGLLVFEIPGALPRARLVGAVVEASGVAATRAALLAPGFPHAERVVVERSPGRLQAPGPDARARILADTGSRVTIATSSAGRALCCLADLDYPGWRVFVDGAEAAKVVVNRAYRGVVVPAGEHTVEWRFESAPAWWGGLLSLLAWLAAPAIVVVRRRTD